MIRYALRCAKSHAFEGWFRDSGAFDAQERGGKLTCPVCGSHKVEKAPMAPAVAKSAEKKARVAPSKAVKPEAAKLREMLLTLRNQVESHCDYVGPRFAEEARKIHYGETEERGIYGETTPEEAEALKEEGIGVASIPWIDRGDA